MAGKKATGDDGLTTKQEAFALAFWETGNAAEAYRRAYDVAPDARDGWLYVEACQLLDNPKVALRLQGLRDQAERLSIFNRDKALAEYEEARQLALTGESPSPAAAVAATNGKVKLFGLEAPTKTKVEHGGTVKTEIQADAAFAQLASLVGSIVPGAKGGDGSADSLDTDGTA